MSIKLLQEAARETRILLERHDPRKLPLSGQVAYSHLKRLPNITKAIEVLITAGLHAEAIGARRPLVDSFIKCTYVLQLKPEGGVPADRTPAARDEAARELLEAEEDEDARMVNFAAPHAPRAFDAVLLTQVAETLERAKAKGKPLDTRRRAEAAGVEPEYRLYFAPTSVFCHGTVRGSLISTSEQPVYAIAVALEHSAAAALRLLNIAAQLLGDEPAAARALELASRIVDRP